MIGELDRIIEDALSNRALASIQNATMLSYDACITAGIADHVSIQVWRGVLIPVFSTWMDRVVHDENSVSPRPPEKGPQ